MTFEVFKQRMKERAGESGVSVSDYDDDAPEVREAAFDKLARAAVQAMGFDVDAKGNIYNPGDSESEAKYAHVRVPPATRVKMRRPRK